MLDIAVRCGVIIVGLLLIREFNEPEPSGDGLPVRMLIPLLVAYLAWNIWIIGQLSRSWLSRSLEDASFFTLLGSLSLARLLWLLPLADDWWWHHRHRLMVLVVASVVCTVVALGEAIRLTMARSSVASHSELPGPPRARRLGHDMASDRSDIGGGRIRVHRGCRSPEG